MNTSICMLVDYFYPDIGGVQVYTKNLLRELGIMGVNAFVITREIPGTPPAEKVDGYMVYRVRMPKFGGGAARSLSYILGSLLLLVKLRKTYQVIHAHKIISTTTIGLLAKMFLGKKLIVTPHSTSISGSFHTMLRNRPVIGPIRFAWIRTGADRFTSISRQVFNDLLLIGAGRRKIVPIPNGIDAERFSPLAAGARGAQREALGFQKDQMVILFVGRLVPVKQVDKLLAAMPDVFARIPGTRLVILGDGPERGSLETACRTLGLSEKVRFMGSVLNVLDYMRCADCFVLPSEVEAMPIALMEAMSCGLPSLATGAGGILDIINDGINGIFITPENKESLGSAFVALLSDREKMRALGSAARRHIMENFSLRASCIEYMKLYRELSEGKAGNR